MNARLSLSICVACLAGCSSSKPLSGTSAPTAEAGPVVAKTIQPKVMDLTWEIEQPGTVQPLESTPLVAKLPGYVKTMAKDIGDAVKAGEVMAVIAIPELERELEQKQAAVAFAEAEIEQSRAGIAVAAESVLSAEALTTEAKAGLARTQADYERWESELKRIETLVSQKVIDAQTLDETRKQFRTASASREEVNAKVASTLAMGREAAARKLRAEADFKAALAKHKAALADAKRTETLLDYREVRSPYDGVVTGRFVHTGHFLQPGNNRAETLFTVARLDTVRVFVDVPESAASQAFTGAKCTVRFPALGQVEIPAVVARTTGILNPETRSLRTEIDLPNPKLLYRPGSYAMVRLKAEATAAVVVPGSCLLYADETTYAFFVEGGKAVKMRVQIGRVDPKGTQLFGKKRAAVNAGEWAPVGKDDVVVSTNLGALSDGAAVQTSQ